MKDILTYEPEYVFRPIDTGDYLRYSEGKWIPDDGEFDLAFISIRKPFAYGVSLRSRENILWSFCRNMDWGAKIIEHPRYKAWHYMLREGERKWGDFWEKRRHPNEIAMWSAMDKSCTLFSCANGRGPEFHIYDSYIQMGLLKVKDGDIVKIPDKFICMYCGEIDIKDDKRRLGI